MNTYEVLNFETLDSTNDYVKDHVDSLKDHTLVITDHQNKGRGRRENRWESASGKNFLGTFYNQKTSQTNYQSMMNGVITVVRTLESLGVEPSIKPPNDVYVQGRKIAGVLSEVIHKDKQHMIIGIGFNVNEHKESPSISLSDVTQSTHDLNQVVELMKSNMEEIEAMSVHSTFEKYIQKIPFDRIYAHNDILQGELEFMDVFFNCTVEGEEVPCESLTFEYR